MTRAAALLLVALASLFVSLPARAQSDIEIGVRASPEVVEVGEVFRVELSAVSPSEVDFTAPSLQLPPGLRAGSPAVGPKMMVQMGAGGSMFRRGITAVWRVTASEPGEYVIPPPAVRADGRTVTADGPLRVTVVAQGQKARQPSAFDPFDFPDDPFDVLDRMRRRTRRNELILDQPVSLEALGPIGRRLALPRAEQPYIFLRVVPDKRRAVVGEQITLVYYLYYRVQYELTALREPPLAGFLRVPIEDEPGQSPPKMTSVGGRMWNVRELNRVAVFPLRAGTLHTGSMEGGFRVRYLKNEVVEHASMDHAIEVVEPPLAGRPAGYRLGTVGRFDLKAEVAPRTTTAGDTVSVRVRVEGRGSLPNELVLPRRTGVEWLTPEKREEVNVRRGRIGGWRTFGYAVRLLDEGEVDLGAIELPYFDPDRGEYRVARAELGTVRVGPRKQVATGQAAASVEAAADVEDPFDRLAKHRTSRLPYEASAKGPPDPRWFWGLVALPPVAVVLLGAALRGAQALGHSRRERRKNPESLCRAALSEMGRQRDGKEIAVSGERALHHAIEATTGIKSRGVLLDELPRELAGRGLDAELAERVSAALEACSAMRFDPSPRDEDAAELAARIRRIAKEVLSSDVAPVAAKDAAEG